MTEGYILDAKTAKPLGKVDGDGTTVEHRFDALNVTLADPKPKVETVRETHVEFRADGLFTAKVDTFMTAKELRRLVRELRKVKR